jgi:hypothetical protein
MAIYPDTFPVEAVRRRLYDGYNLLLPTQPLPVTSPAVTRLRVR